MDINFKKELTYQLVCKVEKKCKNLAPNQVFSFKVDRKFKDTSTADYIKNVLQFFGLNAVVDMALDNQRKNITVYGQLIDGKYKTSRENINKANRWLNEPLTQFDYRVHSTMISMRDSLTSRGYLDSTSSMCIGIKNGNSLCNRLRCNQQELNSSFGRLEKAGMIVRDTKTTYRYPCYWIKGNERLPKPKDDKELINKAVENARKAKAQKQQPVIDSFVEPVTKEEREESEKRSWFGNFLHTVAG